MSSKNDNTKALQNLCDAVAPAVFGKRQYKAIAMVFEDQVNRATYGPLLAEMADMFEKDNHQFNRKKFYEMAGYA